MAKESAVAEKITAEELKKDIRQLLDKITDDVEREGGTPGVDFGVDVLTRRDEGPTYIEPAI